MSILKTLTLVTVFLISFKVYAQNFTNCDIAEETQTRILLEVAKKNPKAIFSLPKCFKLDRELILKATLIDPSQLQNADEILRGDEIFVHRLMKAKPSILQYASEKLRGNKTFMEKATYLSRDSLQYASKKLLDNRIFMKKMIDVDSRNYKFASKRLKEIAKFAEIAFEDDGLLLAHAPSKIKSDIKLVRIAFRSNNNSIIHAAESLQKHKEFKIKKTFDKRLSKEDFTNFIRTNYIATAKKKDLDSTIYNKAKFFPKNKLIDRNYITKWQKDYISNDLKLITVDSRNYQAFWQDDFLKYPALITKVEKFFLKHNIDYNTIDSLSTTYLWRIKNESLTLAFNLYLLRDSSDEALGPRFSDVTSLTAIVQKHNNRWKMTVIEVIFSSETKMSVDYPGGHKKYILWDLYKENDKDNNPKLIFKIEDKFKKNFELFQEESGGKYKKLYHIEPI